MKLKKILLLILLAFAFHGFGQNSVTEINTKLGVKYLTKSLKYPIMGTYKFEGTEPIVTLNANGTGMYQLHDEPVRPIQWGIECSKEGESKFIKGFDSAAYTLLYEYTDGVERDTPVAWKSVELSVHFNKKKIYIQGEPVKDFNPIEKKK